MDDSILQLKAFDQLLKAMVDAAHIRTISVPSEPLVARNAEYQLSYYKGFYLYRLSFPPYIDKAKTLEEFSLTSSQVVIYDKNSVSLLVPRFVDKFIGNRVIILNDLLENQLNPTIKLIAETSYSIGKYSATIIIE